MDFSKFLQHKYKDIGINACIITFNQVVGANSVAKLIQTVDRVIDFYPKSMVAHAFKTDATATQGRFLITSITFGTERNLLYGNGIYSDIINPLANATFQSNASPVKFEGMVEGNRNITFNVTNQEAFAINLSIYLFGELKPHK